VNTVLVVDDRPDARYSMARPLAAAGFDVRETAIGRDALRLARLEVDASSSTSSSQTSTATRCCGM
jgi:CheY-like chemotaxis protein